MANRKPTRPGWILNQAVAEEECLQRGRCQMVAPDAGHGAILVASEPLSQDPGWDLVPPNSLALIRPGEDVELQSIASGD